MQQGAYHTYCPQECVIFRKTREHFGGLSNMAGGFPLVVEGIPILTSEALYQALRFPHLPDLQAAILDRKSPMAAKFVSRAHRGDSRADWDLFKIAVMRWCLAVKLAQHAEQFGEILRETGERPIVEESRRDPFWGALPQRNGTLLGENHLGELLVEHREQFRVGQTYRPVAPPDIPNFLLMRRPIGLL